MDVGVESCSGKLFFSKFWNLLFEVDKSAIWGLHLLDLG